jgi:hypothetical protein
MSGDWFDDVDFPPQPAEAAPPPGEREQVPEGEHAMEIRKVIDHDDKLEIRLAHGERRYGWVFCRLPKSADWAKRIANELRVSLSIPKGGLMAAIEAGDLEGKTVIARIYHRATDRGTFVNVGGFKGAVQPPEPAAKKPQKTKAPDLDNFAWVRTDNRGKKMKGEIRAANVKQRSLRLGGSTMRIFP